MKVTLFDFQRTALHPLRDKIVAARKFASTDNPQAIAFSAPTGSGKTIIMTALFEAILDQPDDELTWPLDWAPQPDAVILWISDMPELNEQTKLKIESKSDKVYRVNQLITIDAHFDAPRLDGGRIYFINTQKLAVNQPLTNRGDSREHLIWETLTNTARAIPDRFYVVIDEAQNCTYTQIKMLLTRLGWRSTMVLTGDPDQTDLLPGISGLAEIASRLERVPDIPVVRLAEGDIVRHPLVASMLTVL